MNILEILKLSIFEEPAKLAYSVGYRPYHNFTHASDVIAGCVKIGHISAPLILAALYHDAIYIAGANYNEEMSSLLLRNNAIRLNHPRGTVNMDDVDAAQELIECTTIQHHLSAYNIDDPDDMELATLLDADLQALSLPYPEFQGRQYDILRENFIFNDKEGRQKTATFLKQFLTCREYIYHTPYARKNWEEQARDNITRFCTENDI
jgi:predicted metal-dependent HD superfamily phosphohydrolase